MSVVLDTSALLAVIFDEPGGERVAPLLGSAFVGAVNLAEAAAKLTEKGMPMGETSSLLLGLVPRAVPFDHSLALQSGILRSKTTRQGLSLGDRACLALAISMDATAMTADRVWADLDLPCKVEVIR